MRLYTHTHTLHSTKKDGNYLLEGYSLNKKSIRGITLIALVITIIILLILAGVSLSMIFNSNGLFSRANDTAKRYNKAKARETLEILLSDAQIQKYAEGLTEEQLDKKIQEIGELMDKEDPNPNIQDVVVEGHIFKIDKSVPKIIDYVSPADGIIITAVLSNNATDGWLSADESDVNIKGKIVTYSGGKLTEVTAKIGETPIEITIDKDGLYQINHITESGTVKVHAKDSKGKDKDKDIEVQVRVDKTAPTVETVKAEVEGKKIKISATGHDKDTNGEEQSGIKQFNYTITPSDEVTNASGTFSKNEVAEITITNWVLYTIKVTATDKCGNTTADTNAKEQTVDMTDTTPPTIKTAEAKASKYTIKIKATAEDNQSGLASLKYSITPTTGLPTGKNEGNLPQNGQEVAITSTTSTTYTVTITATDNAGNPATRTITGVKTSDAMSVEDVINTVNSSNLKDYIGTRVDYKPAGDPTGVWRIFYQDNENGDDGNGYFGDGKGTVYLKRDYDENLKSTLTETATATAVGTARMKKMNPLWAKSANASDTDLVSEKAVSWMCTPSNWSKYCDTSVANYAVAGPSVEMYMKAYNVWAAGTSNESNLMCKIGTTSGFTYGYSLGAHNSYTWNGSNEAYTGKGSITNGPNNIFMTTNHNWLLASPASNYNNYVCGTNGGEAYVDFFGCHVQQWLAPVVSLIK